jgi:hypothetical protein
MQEFICRIVLYFIRFFNCSLILESKSSAIYYFNFYYIFLDNFMPICVHEM